MGNLGGFANKFLMGFHNDGRLPPQVPFDCWACKRSFKAPLIEDSYIHIKSPRKELRGFHKVWRGLCPGCGAYVKDPGPPQLDLI